MILIVTAFGANKATALYSVSEEQVSHTLEVKTALADMRSNLLRGRAGTLSYILTGDAGRLAEFDLARQEFPVLFANLSRLTADNHSQQQRLATLKPLVDQRLGAFAEAIDLHKSGQGNFEAQQELATSGDASIPDIHGILLSMEKEEESLLEQRQKVSDLRYQRVRTVLLLAFCATLLLLFVNFQRLLIELRDRERAEDVVRRLSGRILQIQDEERRRISRELHDSVGQLFVALKLNLGRLVPDQSVPDKEKAKFLAECYQLLDQGISEVRTLSHLLHPPLLDELGFASAAEWFVGGFSKRSNLRVNLELPPSLPRMPHSVELTLFRVLQESLTNVHRHAKSSAVDIRLECSPGWVQLAISDDGKGIPAGLIESFNKTGAGSGVGLAGLRERMIDLGGKLEIKSGQHGTLLQVFVPLPNEEESISRSSGASPSENKREQTAGGQPAMDPPGSSMRSAPPGKSRA
jgi:signal transduction histidine kinase